MKILALDSTAKTASVAVAEEERILASFTVDSGMTQSELLLPMARSALEAVHLSFSDISLFAVTVGPGSFTGVRIGAALVKGLAFGREVPCVPVSVMEALAEGLMPLDGLYCPVTDARRAHVYNALFCMREGRLVRLCEDRLISIEALVQELAATYPDTPIRPAGDAAAALLQAGSAKALCLLPTPPALCLPSAAAVARCALAAAARGEAVEAAKLAPRYLFPSQAERDRLEKMEKEQEKDIKKETK